MVAGSPDFLPNRYQLEMIGNDANMCGACLPVMLQWSYNRLSGNVSGSPALWVIVGRGWSSVGLTQESVPVCHI